MPFNGFSCETNATGYAYDALQRLVTATDALSGVTTLGYDGLDNLASAEDQRSHTTSFTYNAFGDVTGETSPDRGAISYTHDKAGNVTSRTDARSVVTNYTWDELNRVTFVAYPADSSLNVSLTYDLTTGCGTAGIGRLCSLSDSSGVTEYEYNDLGQVTDATETRGGLTFATAYTYDLAGNILTETLPSGRVVTYTRNANGQVSSVSAVVSGSGTTLASSIAYLPFGPMSGLTYGNSLTFSASYDQDYYPTNRTVSALYNYTYDTDDNGNITQAGTPTYGYDALNRLNADSTISATSYTYDATSNRLTKVMGGTTSTTVPSTSNKISAVGGTSYTYDASGNITAIGTSGYVWNNAGLMKESKISGSTVGTYTYDYQNRRTKKVAGGVTTHYVYDLNGLLIGEYTSAGALTKEYVYLNGAPLAMIDAGSPQVLTYLHTNHLGTPIFGTNTGGTQVWAWAPDVFGNGAPTGSRTVNLRMPGQYYDSESSLFYNWNRYYNPATGRYISGDPIGIEGGLNVFNYVGASPVMYSDLTGLDLVYLNDQNAAVMPQIGPQGHAAFLVGNDLYGWTYYSKNGIGNNTMANFESLDSFYRNNLASRYTGAAYLQTSVRQDVQTELYANTHYRDSYSLVSNNCGDLVSNSFRAGGVNISSGSLFLPTRPNQQYQSVQRLIGGISIPAQQARYPHSIAP